MKDMAFLKTATGKEYPCDFMGVAQGFILYIKLKIDLNEVLKVFQNPDETVLLQWYGANGKLVREEKDFTIFNGFLITDGPCPIRIRLQKNL